MNEKNEQAEREAFEKFATEKFFDMTTGEHGYTSWPTRMAWKVWRDTHAAASQADQSSGESASAEPKRNLPRGGGQSWASVNAAHNAAPSASAQQAEPVGEVVLFGQDLKEVSWRNGRMPEAGTRLYAAPAPTQGTQEPVAEVLDWLNEEISAVSCRYRGSPSYDHDAYWLKEKALALVADARKAFAAPAPKDAS